MKLNFEAKIKMEGKQNWMVAENLVPYLDGEKDPEDQKAEYLDEEGRVWALEEYLSSYKVLVSESGDETMADEEYTAILRTPVLDESDRPLLESILAEMTNADNLEKANIQMTLWAEARGVQTETEYETGFGFWKNEDCEGHLDRALSQAKEDLVKELLK